MTGYRGKEVKGVNRGEATFKNGQAIEFEEIEPWGEKVGGAELLGEIERKVANHVIVSKHSRVAVSVWSIFTHLHEHAAISPMLVLTSPQKRCGKTTLFTILNRLCYKALPASNITPSGVFRTIQDHAPTMLIDEADTFVPGNEQFRGIINSGHTREFAYVIRTERIGDEFIPCRYSTWAPKAISAIGHMPETIEDRSIEIRLERKYISEIVEPLGFVADDKFRELVRMMARWAKDNAEAFKIADPLKMRIPGLDDRAQDNWFPLLVIANMAEGDWPELTREAVLSSIGHKEKTIEIRLLEDCKDYFERVEWCTPTQLHSYLVSLEDRPWASWYRGFEISQKKVGALLGAFEIESDTDRIGTSESIRKYHKRQFEEVFARYLDPSPIDPPSQSDTSDTINENKELEKSDLSHNCHNRHTRGGSVADCDGSVSDKETRNPLKLNDVSDVTDRRTPPYIEDKGNGKEPSTNPIDGLDDNDFIVPGAGRREPELDEEGKPKVTF